MGLRSVVGCVVALGALMGCASDPTVVRLVVESDLDVPGQLDRVDLQLMGGGFDPAEATLDLAGAATLPGSLAVRYGGSGGLGPYDATAIGFLAGAEVVRTTAPFTFVEGRETTVTLTLSGACVAVRCDARERCVDGVCEPIGTPDAGVDAGGDLDAGPPPMRTPPPAPCDRACDMCGETCTDVRWDEGNCGSCGTACGAGEQCLRSTCVACMSTMCDGECVDTDTALSHCGGCGVSCAAAERCAGGRCAPADPGEVCGAPVVLGVGTHALGTDVPLSFALVDGGYRPRCFGTGAVNQSSVISFTAPSTGTLRVAAATVMNATFSFEVFAGTDDRCRCPLTGACAWATDELTVAVEAGVTYLVVFSINAMRDGTLTLEMI